METLVAAANAVSIHAPTRGATRVTSITPSGIRCFNPRAHEGRDVGRRSKGGANEVSIHAPTRGATDD